MEKAHKFTGVPIALITNMSLLTRPDVFDAATACDLAANRLVVIHRSTLLIVQLLCWRDNGKIIVVSTCPDNGAQGIT